MSWIENCDGHLINLEGVDEIQVVGKEVRAYRVRAQHPSYAPLATFDSEAKANAYRDAIKVCLARGQRMGSYRKLTEGI